MEKGDRVKLSKSGVELFESHAYPSIVGGIYYNISKGNAEILRIEDNYARIKIIEPGYPATMIKENDFGVLKTHLEVIDE